MKPLKDVTKVDFCEYNSILRTDLDYDQDKRLNKCLCFYLPSHCSSGTVSTKYLIGCNDLLFFSPIVQLRKQRFTPVIWKEGKCGCLVLFLEKYFRISFRNEEHWVKAINAVILSSIRRHLTSSETIN